MFKRFFGWLGEIFRQADLLLLLLCTAATLFGMVLITSATHFMGTLHYTLIQGVSMLIGIALYLFFSTLDTEELSRHWKILFAFNVGFILLLLTPFGVEGNTGNRAWLDFPFLPVNIQPAEIVKVTFILLLARQLAYLSENRDLRKFGNVVQPVAHLGFMLGLIFVISSDAGSCLVYVFVFFCMTFAAGMALRWFAVAVGVIAAGGFAVWKFDLLPEYMRDRFLVVLDHSYQPLGKGWHQTRSMLALGSGQLWGQGLFHGTQTQSVYKSSLPERHTDFIFSVCGEELGLVGCVLVLALLLAIIIRCLIVARDASTRMESLVCVGMAAMLIFQTVANTGMCLFMLPVVGLTLPFFSYGGSSIVTLFASMGIVSGIRKRSRPDWLLS